MFRPISFALMATASLGLASAAIAQNPPDEQSATRALNTQVSERLRAADRSDAADAASYRAAVAQYEADLQRYDVQSNRVAHALEARGENIQHEQALYNQRMAEWRAIVAACERGDRLGCENGKAPDMPPR